MLSSAEEELFTLIKSFSSALFGFGLGAGLATTFFGFGLGAGLATTFFGFGLGAGLAATFFGLGFFVTNFFKNSNI